MNQKQSIKTFYEKLAEAKRTQKEVNPDEVKRRIDSGKRFLIVDVRETEEFKRGQIPVKEFKIAKNPDCAYCGEGKKFPGYVDYEEFCRNS